MPRERGSFEDWKEAVDMAIMARMMGLNSDDIEDWRYHQDYKEGYTAEQSARRALRNAGAY